MHSAQQKKESEIAQKKMITLTTTTREREREQQEEV